MKTRRRVALTGTCLVLLAVGGCSGTAAPPLDLDQAAEGEVPGGERIADSLEALFEEYLARDDLSAFERGVLERASESGEIAAEDYEDAHAQEAACMEDAGYDIGYEKLVNGIYASTPHLPQLEDAEASTRQVEVFMAASEGCSEGVSMVVESLYTLQQGNPELLVDQDEVAVRCLRAEDLVTVDYTAETFAADLVTSFTGAPFDPASPAARACFAGASIAFVSTEE